MHKSIVPAAIALMVAFLLGCGGEDEYGNQLVGSWQKQLNPRPKQPFILKVNSDKTYSMSGGHVGKWRIKRGQLVLKETSHYRAIMHFSMNFSDDGKEMT